MTGLLPGGCNVADPYAVFGSGDFIEAIICTFGNTMTVAGFLLFCWFVVSSISYIRTKSVAMPIVLLLLIGGATVPRLPSVGIQVAAVLVLGGISSVVVIVARRIDRI